MMLMKKLLIISALFTIIYACGDNAADNNQTSEPGTADNTTPGSDYDTSRGAGKFTNVEVSPTLDQAKADAGEKVYEVKCASCHKLSDERLVGPGWKGVTGRHKPEWIMNFVTNVDEMLEKDPKAQAQLEVCLVRMPNQNLSDNDARNVFEFMRENDGVK
jgi:mono/diheme cytochrome c family protein